MDKRELRILIPVHVFFPRWVYGTEVYTLTLARALQARGHTVQVLTCESNMEGAADPVGVEEPYEDVPVHRLTFNVMDADNPVRADYHNPHVERYLLDYLADYQPDLIHATHGAHLSTAVITAAKKRGLPVIATLTDFWYICPTSQLLRYDGQVCSGPISPSRCVRCYIYQRHMALDYRWIVDRVPAPLLDLAIRACRGAWAERDWRTRLVRALLQRPAWMQTVLSQMDLIFAPSHFLRRMYVQNGAPADRIRVSPYVIDTGFDRFPPKRPSDHLRFAFIGMIAPHKGVDVLVRAFEGLPNPGNATLQLFGNASHYAEYAQQVLAHIQDNPRITYEGEFPNEQVGEVLAGVDVLVVPSVWYENTPVVMSEAFASKTPVIATDLGGMTESIERYGGGWTFPRGDVGALAARMQALIDDPAQIARAAAEIRPLRTVEEHLEDVEAAYAEVLEMTRQNSRS